MKKQAPGHRHASPDGGPPRARRKPSSPQHIGQILETLFRETGLADPIRENRALLFWEDAVGRDVSRHAQPAYMEKGVLWVEVDHSVRMHSLQMQEEDLRRRLNRKVRESGAPAGTVRSIRFRLRE